MTTSKTPSADTLERVPLRMLQFLRGVGLNITIRALLATRGLKPEHIEEGWKLLRATGAVARENESKQTPFDQFDQETSTAFAEVDRWDEPNFLVAAASLEHEFPEQYAFVFGDGLSASQGAASVVGVRTFLERLDALEAGKDRKKSHKTDLAAIALLSERGITADERKRVWALLRTIEKVQPVQAAPKAKKTEEGPSETLLAAWRWYATWSAIARATLTRRDHLIRVGLAKRKQKKPGEPEQP